MVIAAHYIAIIPNPAGDKLSCGHDAMLMVWTAQPAWAMAADADVMLGADVLLGVASGAGDSDDTKHSHHSVSKQRSAEPLNQRDQQQALPRR